MIGRTGHPILISDWLQLHLRQCLYPEAVRKNLSLPHYYQRFHDLRKQFSSLVTSPEPAAGAEQDSGSGNLGTSVEEMLAQLHLQGDDTQVSRDTEHTEIGKCVVNISI